MPKDEYITLPPVDYLYDFPISAYVASETPQNHAIYHNKHVERKQMFSKYSYINNGKQIKIVYDTGGWCSSDG